MASASWVLSAVVFGKARRRNHRRQTVVVFIFSPHGVGCYHSGGSADAPGALTRSARYFDQIWSNQQPLPLQVAMKPCSTPATSKKLPVIRPLSLMKVLSPLSMLLGKSMSVTTPLRRRNP